MLAAATFSLLSKVCGVSNLLGCAYAGNSVNKKGTRAAPMRSYEDEYIKGLESVY